MPPQQPASQPTSTVWKYPVRTTGQSVSPAGIGWNDQEMVPLDQYGIQEPRGKKHRANERPTTDLLLPTAYLLLLVWIILYDTLPTTLLY